MHPVIQEPIKTKQLLEKIEEQARSIIFKDADDVFQIVIIDLAKTADLSLTEATDIIDSGNNFRVSFTPVDEIYNRIILNWGFNLKMKNVRLFKNLIYHYKIKKKN